MLLHTHAFVSGGASQSLAAALAAFREAESIDDTHADLLFRIARCIDRSASLPATEAERYYVRAAVHDAYHARPGTELNGPLRAAFGASPGFIDLEALARGTPLVGREGMFDHVHFTIAGHAAAAAAILPGIATGGKGVAAPPALTPAQVLTNLGYCAFDAHEAAWAVARFTLNNTAMEAIRQHPETRAWLIRQYGSSFVDQGWRTNAAVLSAATNAYAIGLARNWENASLHVRAALACESLGDHTGALDHLAAVMRINPFYRDADVLRARIHQSRGIERYHRGDYRGAIEDFSARIAITNTAASYANRALAYRALGNEQNAARDEDAARQLAAPAAR